jgi:thioester reductase-like protein
MTTQVAVMFAKNYPDNKSLRHLSAGGEKLVSINPPSYAFHNGYGPTECTIFSTIFDVADKEPNIPIGHPLANLRLYITDTEGRRLPAGAVGELWISGPQVSRGYLNRPEKTAETFIPNPFESGYPYDRVYRTGDIVRYRMDGNIEFVGRNDGQIKIRGFRVETKEVESVIREFPNVKDVTVQPFDNPSGGKFIAAYIVCDGELDTKALSDFILQRKPPYMVPAAFAKLEKIPLNVNQKVDRKALPSPVMSSNESYVAPEGDTEKALCEIFADILGLERVGATDNFFDLGGSSLMVTSVLVSAEKRGLKFSYGDVFNNPTARALTSFIGGGEVKPAEDKDDVYGYDYSEIDKVLAGNTLEAFLEGERIPLGGNILLTGATGFLGIHVLRELIEQTDKDSVIWCLLRGRGSITAEQRLAEMLVYYFKENYRQLIGSRIRLIQGDMSDASVFDAIINSGTKIDLVVNCAANVKHFSRGDDILKVNYYGVVNLAGFCMARGARLLQVSTISVGGMTDKPVPEVLSENMLFFGQNTDNQYVVSKFLAERYILEKVAEGRLKAKIIRVGNLSPRAEDGEFQINFNSNASMGRLKAYRMLGACPYQLLESKMEFSPIDDTARAVVLLAGTPDANVVFHASNDHLLPMDDILSRLHKDDGSPLDYVETDEFVRRMDAAKDDPEKSRILSSIIAYAQAEGQVQLQENIATVDFSMQVLHRLGFRWDSTTRDYVDMIFEMLASMNFFGD